MKINLLVDYRGVLTNEVYYQAGVIDVDPAIAASLVNEGRAVYIDEPEPEPVTKPRAGRKKED